jgi:hypothetical protein
LWGLIILGIAYCGAIASFGELTGNPKLDGSLGVLLGLFICSRPAAHVIDLLFQRGALRRMASKCAGVRWAALSGLAFVTGWIVITLGATRLIG